MRFFKTAGIAIVIVTLGALAQADLITTPGLTITSGDKTFSNFTCTVGTNTGLAIPLTCADISIVPTTSGGLFGIDILGNFTALAINPSAFTTSAEDVTITYDVSATAPNLISDVHMGFNGSGAGLFSTSVTEQVQDPLTAAVLAQISVSNPPPIFTAFANLSNPEGTVAVTKDIALSAFAPTNPSVGLANISIITQTFSQTVPEPASMLLLGAGLLGLGGLMRKKFASK